MLIKTGIGLIGLVFQVLALPPGQYVQPGFIADVIRQVEAENTDNSRIVSGWDAYPGQHPHQAALRMVDSIGSVSACGGSVISREWVITAAHCTAQRITIVVRAGVTNLTNPEYISESTEYYNHPSYNSNFPSVVQPNDISIVKLPSAVVYTRLLQAIRIQSSSDAYRDYNAQVMYTSGHGRLWTGGATTEHLNWVYLTGVTNALCQATFGPQFVTDTTICARYYNVTSQSTCNGDSGGPLVHVASDGTPILVGVTSFVAGGNFGCHSGIPAAFVRPGPFHSWFTEISGIDFENLDEEEVTEPPATEPSTTQPPTTQPPTTQPPTTEPPTTQPPTTEPPTTQPPTTQPPTTQPPTTQPPTTQPPTTEPTDPVEPEDEDDDEEEDDSDEDAELADLLKRLEVKVKVKVKMNKYKWKKKIHKQIPS
ncbi:hypothetical protein K1T71_011509 [Dendrolimus kikuchii]|uniref:Uncharacterized protein n=1 Tax=Dendrolimus kikuchii TaxID=765133 RepID=A0ACC1CP24_9NEOP|nr:hypothetical protein K1T71_011509 [Dendrolimus kikuchii]